MLLKLYGFYVDITGKFLNISILGYVSEFCNILVIITSNGIQNSAAAKSLQSCPTLCDPIDSSPPGNPRPWDSPGKNTGVGCHLLLQCMKIKSESEVTQSCLTSSNPMDCNLPGSSIHGIFQARVLEWGAMCRHHLFVIHSPVRGPLVVSTSWLL